MTRDKGSDVTLGLMLDRRRIAQGLMVLAAISLVLPWEQTVDQETLRGVALNEGLLVLVASVLSIGLIQVGLRPAWMGPGFVVAVLGRQLISGVAPNEVRFGMVVTLVLAFGATAVLLADMVSAVGGQSSDVPRRSTR